MGGKGGFDAGKTIKTAFWFSRIDFYFVTGFYLLYDICMADIKTFFDKNTLACDIQSAAPTKTKQYKSISEYSLYLLNGTTTLFTSAEKMNNKCNVLILSLLAMKLYRSFLAFL